METVKISNDIVECKNFVGGRWQAGSGQAFKIHSPYTNATIGQGQASSVADVNTAVAQAQAAFPKWAQTPIKERSQVMFRLREILLRDLAPIAQVISSESGKTLAESKAGIMKGIEVLEFALSLQNTDSGGRMQVSRGVFCQYQREPLGVVAGITPFNFPAMVPMWMLPIAITLGNSFVWKPSDKTPLTSIKIAEAFNEAGLPPGVLTVLQGGKETVEAILDHPEIKAAGFVGSTPVARAVYQRGSQHGKRVLALGGAKNHIILLPDADREITGRGVCDSFTGCAGQRCMAASTLLAVGDVEPFIEDIVKQAKAIELGSGMGAIISKESLGRLNEAIEQAEKDGAKVILDGRKTQAPKDYPDGYWLGPTILDHVKPGSHAATTELFGPVLTIIRCQNLSDALAIENANPYGNAASVFTQNGGAADHVSRNARAGMVGVNIGVPVPREPFSFGGFYESRFGAGDITGMSGVDFWSQTKKITTKWAAQSDTSWMG